MVPHGQENPVFNYTLAVERQVLLATKTLRGVPQKGPGKLLTATWNLTNFGLQARTDDDIALMAEVIGWFDFVAIQEIADDLGHLRSLLNHLPASYSVIISDIGGNYERTGFLYDSSKVTRLELAAEITIPPAHHRYIRMRGVSGAFKGFDRNPYVAAFRAGRLEFTAVSAHLYFGSNAYFNEDRRALEAYALSRWADQRHKAPGAYSQNILVMGDLNLPIRNKSSTVYRALKANRLILPQHSTSIGSNLAGDKHYDQVAFHAGGMKDAYTGNSGVFDFDHSPFFVDAWNSSPDYFNAVVKYHIADHRPLWAEFDI
ncbi:MAG: endonuclease/exonuclease/phosphatase family protein [Gammaproteobacteria bacterium]